MSYSLSSFSKALTFSVIMFQACPMVMSLWYWARSDVCDVVGNIEHFQIYELFVLSIDVFKLLLQSYVGCPLYLFSYC